MNRRKRKPTIKDVRAASSKALNYYATSFGKGPRFDVEGENKQVGILPDPQARAKK